MPAADQYRRVFYHGTASHDAEKRWLRPVAEEVLRRDDRIVFEIVGGQAVDRLYRGLPRVNVVHQMKWPAYQAFLALPGRHIGLAPLLRLPFNRARSYTKFFDITRCGAAGIYADHGACAAVVSDGEDGLLVPQKHEAWVEAILRVAQDEPLRQALVRNAHARLDALVREARDGYPGMTEP
jgi:glycosyltransferase involved in cell wall biosynthesis